jgi:ArsR family transcriptional regulator, arsenate/arsenite/antimonite-responsive transcriptional repressor
MPEPPKPQTTPLTTIHLIHRLFSNLAEYARIANMNKFLKQTKALADGSRLRITAALFRYPELCVCQITELLGLATATVSRHISVLQNAQLVESRKDGRWVFYRISEDFPEQLRLWIRDELMPSRQVLDDQAKLDIIASCTVEEICRKNRGSTQ